MQLGVDPQEMIEPIVPEQFALKFALLARGS